MTPYGLPGADNKGDTILPLWPQCPVCVSVSHTFLAMLLVSLTTTIVLILIV